MKTNDKNELVSRSRIAGRGLVLIDLLAMALICLGISPAQTSAAAAATAVAKPAAALASSTSSPTANTPTSPAAKTPSQGPHEGITVHGYWTIDVRNPDGKLAKHLEFENQLCTTFTDLVSGVTVPGGDTQISSMLVGSNTAGLWSIILGNQESPISTTGPGGQTFLTFAPNCAIVPQYLMSQSGYQGGASALAGTIAPFSLSCSGSCFPVLNVPSNNSDGTLNPVAYPYTTNISLSGQFTVPGTAAPVTISAVGTDLFTCFQQQSTGILGSSPPIYPQYFVNSSPAFCQNMGNFYGQNQGTNNCNISTYTQGPNPVPGGPNLNPSLNATETVLYGCTPNTVPNTEITMTYPVGGQTGRSPFSGVVLTGSNGVPAAFQVSGGQTVAVTWTLSFH